MYMPASFEDALLIFLKIDVEMIENMVLDLRRGGAQCIELRQRLARLRPLDDEAGFDIGQRALKLRIVKRVRGIFLEIERSGVHGCSKPEMGWRHKGEAHGVLRSVRLRGEN